MPAASSDLSTSCFERRSIRRIRRAVSRQLLAEALAKFKNDAMKRRK